MRQKNWNFIQRRLLSKTNHQKVSRHWVQYPLHRELEAGSKVERKRAGAPKVTTAVADKHLVIESKRPRTKGWLLKLIHLDSNQCSSQL